MRARVRAVPVPEYEAWLDQQSNDIQDAQDAVQQRVQELAGAEAAAAGGAQE
jgi:heme/copper-type cytochrome/quinol oxidase subunit 2